MAIPLEIDYDVLVDALSFLGNGSWGKLQSLIDHPDDESAMPRSAAQDLFLLGFIGIDLRTCSNTIKSWCVPPPALNFHDPSEAFISGFRSNSLLAEIELVVKQAGGSFIQELHATRSAKVIVRELDARAARLSLAAIRDPRGRPISPDVALSRDAGHFCWMRNSGGTASQLAG